MIRTKQTILFLFFQRHNKERRKRTLGKCRGQRPGVTSQCVPQHIIRGLLPLSIFPDGSAEQNTCNVAGTTSVAFTAASTFHRMEKPRTSRQTPPNWRAAMQRWAMNVSLLLCVCVGEKSKYLPVKVNNC